LCILAGVEGDLHTLLYLHLIELQGLFEATLITLLFSS
jgi:hypothetical protein